MSKEIKSIAAGGKAVESIISPALKAKLIHYCRKGNISQAQVIRDLIQGLLKSYKIRKK